MKHELQVNWSNSKHLGQQGFHGFHRCETGSTISTLLHDKINPKDCQVKKPLVIQGFSNFLGLFQVIMANPGKLSLISAFPAPSTT